MTNPVREAIPEETARLVRSVLSADLLKPKYRTGNLAGNSAYGHCYAASEACFYLLGGRSSPWRPRHGRDPNGIVHWWLVNIGSGDILDPTADQYKAVDAGPPYNVARSGGFLTKEPSRRAVEIMDRVAALNADQPPPYIYAAHRADMLSACSSTVRTAASWRSGG